MRALHGTPSLRNVRHQASSRCRRYRAGERTAAIDWLRDAFGHLKVIGHTEHAAAIFAKAAVALDADKGVVDLNGSAGIDDFITAAKQHRIWEREPKLRNPG